MQNPTDLALRTKQFARRISRLYAALSREALAQVLVRQLLRSGTSVGADYREASRGRSKAEFILKTDDRLKEADESVYWLELLSDENVVKATKLSALIQETNELISILVTTSKRARGE